MKKCHYKLLLGGAHFYSAFLFLFLPRLVAHFYTVIYTFKHFQAWDRKSKFIYANVYSSAKSMTAKTFLQELLKTIPFKVHSIQVDGGSEFMAHFEEECKNLNIPLFVLPPRKLQYSGGIERANRTFREEFYARKNLLADSISFYATQTFQGCR